MIGVRFQKNKSGVSLIEVLVSVLIFTVIILSATQIFKLVIDGQRSAISSQNVQESIKYFLEVISKEIRTAQKNSGLCAGIDNDQVFATSTNSLGDILKFRNYYGECVSYSMATTTNSQRFRIQRDAAADYISPSKITIDDLHFYLTVSTSSHPMVTISLKAHALDQSQFESEMITQTSLSSRFYK